MSVILAALMLAFPPGDPPRGDGADWLKPPPAGSFTGAGTQEVDEAETYEVVASKLHVAELRDLKDRGYIAITSEQAKYFTGPYFSCPRGKNPYLVRAVYGHGGTGGYSVKREGRKLLVEHDSLGRRNSANKSALIVNLDFEPESMYTVVRIAE